MVSIKVLGPGCANCQRVEEIVKRVIGNLGADAKVDKVTDPREISRYQLIATPGLVVDGRVVCAGRIPGEAEVTTWLVSALEAAR